jgi:hypothetical protein
MACPAGADWSHFVMKLKAKLVLVWMAVMPCLTGGARAMSIHDFGRMNNDDEATFVTLLVQGSAEMLKGKGHPDQAAKVIAFFKTPGKGGGVYSLADEVKTVDAMNKHNSINPNNRVPEYQIEDAMELMLKDQGIIVPAKYLLTITKDFQAAGPPRGRTMGE